MDPDATWQPPLVELFIRDHSDGVQSSWPSECRGLSCLSKTMGWLAEVFRGAEGLRSQFEAHAPLAALKEPWTRASSLLAEADARVKELLAIAEADSLQAEHKFQAFLSSLTKQLATLPVGRSILLPLAWPAPEANQSTSVSSAFFLPLGSSTTRPEQGERPLHAAIIVVQRTAKTTGTFAVVNPSGSGSEYHPRQLNGPPTRPLCCVLPVRIDDVPWPRICCTVFWLLVFRSSLHTSTPTVKPPPTATPLSERKGSTLGEEEAPTALEIKDDGDPHPALLYECLLPFLTQERRSTQMAKQLAVPAVARGGDSDWSRVPHTDDTQVNTLLGAIALALRSVVRSKTDVLASDAGQAQWVVLCLKWEALRRVVEDPAVPPGARTREACRSLARAASEVGFNLAGPSSKWKPALLSSIHTWLGDKLTAADRTDAERQILPEAPSSWKTTDAEAACSHGGFQRLAEFVDTAKLAGNPDRPAVILPTPIVQIPGMVKDYHEAAAVVRQCVRLCSLLSNQNGVISNTDYHIVGLVVHLFTNVFAVPLPSDGFWWNQPMQHETQTVLAHELGQLARHFLAASFNLPDSMHLHSIRLIVLTAILAVVDVTVRRVPDGIESDFSKVYTGSLRDGVHCRGFSIAPLPLDIETAELTIADPQLAQVRTATLDYLAGVEGNEQTAERRIFGFADMRLGEGDYEFLHRLALLRGFVRGDCSNWVNRVGLNQFFLGQPSDFLSAFPGLTALRDTSFLLRWVCVPIGCALLDRRRNDGSPWRASDAQLKWEYTPEEDKFKVTGFQRSLTMEAEGPRRTSGLFGFLFQGQAKLNKRKLSAASPAILTGEAVSTEDDILHMPKVPTFGDRLTVADSELMLVYLTAPYLRVPLLLQFFNDRARFSALASQELQAMLDAALFEPGPFQHTASPFAVSQPPTKGDTPLDVVPVPSDRTAEEMAATPAGRLVNELVHSSDAILPELDGIFRLAMERDTPTFSKDALPVLYTIRLWVRLAAFARQVAACSKLKEAGHAEPPRGFSHASRKRAQALEKRSRAWFTRLRFEAVPTLERWCNRAMESGETDVACTCWLHLALIYRWSQEFSMHSVSTLLCAEVYLNTNMKTGPGWETRADLFGMSESEVFSLFHGVRGEVYRWLKEHNVAHGRDRLLEHVVTVVASSKSSQNVEDANVLGRRWLELTEMWDGAGRFAPSVPTAVDDALAETDFAKWLTGSVDAAPVEINLNIGQLQFRQHTVTPVPRGVAELPEFREVFPNIDIHTSGLRWAMVERTATRKRYRFAGLRIEFREWERGVVGITERSVPLKREFPEKATAQEQWVVRALDAEDGIRELWKARVRWCAPPQEMTGEIAHLMANDPSRGRLIEFEVYRCPALLGDAVVVHAYHTVECGPRFVRVQTFTSNAAWSYAASPQSLESSWSAPSMSMRQEARLLEIVHEDTSGYSVLVPHRLMAGVLPDCLLDIFEFWRPRHDRLVGKMKVEARRGACIPYALVVHLDEKKPIFVERVALDANNRTDEAKQIDLLMHSQSPGKSSQQLINSKSTATGEVLVDLLRARKGSCEWHAARWALQLDDLSHVLVWMRGEVVDGKFRQERRQVDVIEFPRLGLSFSRSDEASGLVCDQHGGLAVVLGPISDPNIIRVLRPFPKFVLLEDDTQEKFALVSVADKPQRTGEGVCLVRNDQDWLEKLRGKTAKHYLFAVHPSFEFISATTPVAELHLMLLRVLHRMYSEACGGVTTCLASGLANGQVDEELLWQLITDTLATDTGVDAAVLRLKLVLGLHRLGRALPEKWRPEADLAEWVNTGHNSFAGRLLTLAEEVALIDLCSDAASNEVKARGGVCTALLHLRLPDSPQVRTETTFEISRRLQNVETAPRGDRLLEDATDLSVLTHMDDTFQMLSHDTVTAESALQPLGLEQLAMGTSNWGGDQKTGYKLVRTLLRHGRPRLPEDFFVLYELACATRNGWVQPSDDPTLSSELLVRLISPEEMSKCTAQAGLLRVLMSSPSIAKSMPTYSGHITNFRNKLMNTLMEHHKTLLAQLKDPPPVYDPPTTPVWKFSLDKQGRWSMTDSHPNRFRGCMTQTLQDFLQNADQPPMTPPMSPRATEDNDDALTNQNLMRVTRLLRDVEDRRLPSPVWDFDAERRALVSKVEPNGEDSHKSDDEFQTASEDDEGGKGGRQLGFEQLPCALRRRLPELLASDFKHLIDRPMMTSRLRDAITETTQVAATSTKELPVLQILSPERCPITATVAGESILRRMRENRSVACEHANASEFLHLTRASVQQIMGDSEQVRALLLEVGKRLQQLNKMLDMDRKTVVLVARIAVDVANDGTETDPADEESHLRRCAHKLGQLGGTEACLTFQDITHLITVKGGAEVVLPHVGRHISTKSVNNMTAACALAMLLSTRTILCKRCINQLLRLQTLLDEAKSSAEGFFRAEEQHSWLSRSITWITGAGADTNNNVELATAIADAATQAATEFTTVQYCVDVDENAITYDPVLLSFQFISHIMLRKKQVGLVRAMVDAVEQKRPLVHQMLMGQGKTTIITPIVGLLASRATRVCVVCTPIALLEFTCSVLRQRLCAALTRPVVVFSFSRSDILSDDLRLRLTHFQETRTVICSGPTSLKSMLLRFLLAIHDMDVARSQEVERKEKAKHQTRGEQLMRMWRRSHTTETLQESVNKSRHEAEILGAAAKVFLTGVLLLDECDLLMHPLRSELHWPLGDQHTLDYTAGHADNPATPAVVSATPSTPSAYRSYGTHGRDVQASFVANSDAGARWQVAFHLLDLVFSCQLPDGPAVKTFSSKAECLAVVKRFKDAVVLGLQEKHLQASPHLTLLSLEFYHEELRPILAEWVLAWARRRHPLNVPDKDVVFYLCGGSPDRQLFQDLGEQQMKSLNLAKSWLAVLLPHVMSRIHRVHYGLLSEQADSWNKESRARRHFAVPFVGKDAPSDTSQFSHPDVVIGLTWVSHRLAGLRPDDFKRALTMLMRLQSTEADLAPRLRHARHLYNAWVSAAGAHVRGDMDGNLNVVSTIDQESLVLQDPNDLHTKGVGTCVVPPLEWLDINDATQVLSVSTVLKLSPFLIEFYLHESVLPQLLRHTDSKLSASGHDLGGENLCGSRLGFSGTPNDLLPRSLGSCVYEPGDDAQMLHTLTDPSVVQVWLAEEGWSAQSILEVIAKERPPLQSLIDVGALITGLSNLEVAQMLLDSGLPYEAVVFCDHGGEQQLLQRGRPDPVRLAHCTLPPERRFVFYDQVHTTGIDIKHAPNACAAVTVGKDSTFRDFAQGAYRMRGVGHGQTLRVLLTPEVVARINAEVPRERPRAIEKRPSTDVVNADPTDAGVEGESTPSSTGEDESTLDRVCAWLLVKQAESENKQQSLLRRHAIAHEGRRCAFNLLQQKVLTQSLSTPASLSTQENGAALDLFRERVDYTVEADLPGSRRNVVNPINAVVERMLAFLDEEGKEVVRSNLIAVLNESGPGGQVAQAHKDVAALLADKSKVLVEALRDQEWELCAEQEQEHEQELFQEQEQEEEQEEEQEQEEEREEVASAAEAARAWQMLPKDEPQDRWRLEALGEHPTGHSGPFYPVSNFELPHPAKRSEVSVPFPSGLWVSRHFHRAGKGRIMRRLRTPAVVLEWVPDEAALARGGSGGYAAGVKASGLRHKLRVAMQMLGLAGKDVLDLEDARRLLIALGVEAQDDEVACLLANICSVQAEQDHAMDDASIAGAGHWGAAPTTMSKRAVVEEAIRRCHAMEMQPGRYYVLITLAEAEAVRLALIRRDKDHPLLMNKPGCSIALRLLCRGTGGLSLLNHSKGWRQTPFTWQESAIAQCVMYLGSETQFLAQELELLRWSLKHGLWKNKEAAAPALLRDFWLASYSLRRRPQPPPTHDVPILHIFNTEEEHAKLRDEAVFQETYGRLCEAGISPEKAFQLLDADHDGSVKPEDFAARTALGLRFHPRLMLQLFQALDQDAKGVFKRSDWRTAFDARHEVTEAAAADAHVVGGDPLRPPENVPLGVLRRIKIEVVTQAAYTMAWSSEGMLCRCSASIWEPDLTAAGFMRTASGYRVCIGHYANQGYADCRGGNRSGVKTRSLLQFRDKNFFGGVQQEHLQAVADHYCPNPKRFRLVWSQLRGRALYVWAPVPPSDAYVALGMVATTSSEQPPVSCVRCVAKSFCQPAHKEPGFLWDDSGSGGKPGSMWIVNNLQLLWMTPGHAAPQGQCWELAQPVITFDDVTGQPSVQERHIKEPAELQRARTLTRARTRTSSGQAEGPRTAVVAPSPFITARTPRSRASIG